MNAPDERLARGSSASDFDQRGEVVHEPLLEDGGNPGALVLAGRVQAGAALAEHVRRATGASADANQFKKARRVAHQQFLVGPLVRIGDTERHEQIPGGVGRDRWVAGGS